MMICGKSYSPRPWGCFPRYFKPTCLWTVFPTGAGVFLLVGMPPTGCFGIPHARGGFCTLKSVTASEQVFPTPVRVFLPHFLTRYETPSIPHARGGVSRHGSRSGKTIGYSHAGGVFRLDRPEYPKANGIPCASGDDSLLLLSPN